MSTSCSVSKLSKSPDKQHQWCPTWSCELSALNSLVIHTKKFRQCMSKTYWQDIMNITFVRMLSVSMCSILTSTPSAFVIPGWRQQECESPFCYFSQPWHYETLLSFEMDVNGFLFGHFDHNANTTSGFPLVTSQSAPIKIKYLRSHEGNECVRLQL